MFDTRWSVKTLLFTMKDATWKLKLRSTDSKKEESTHVNLRGAKCKTVACRTMEK